MNSELKKSLLSVKSAIKETKQYLNYEFRKYYTNVKHIEPSEWFWIINPYKVIESEKPNFSIDFAKKCSKLYIDIFEFEANKFLSYCREGLMNRQKGLPEIEIQQKIWSQYDLWRTRFTIEANSIIESIDKQLGINESNGIKPVQNTKSLKKKISENRLKEVIDILINEYDLDKEKQNQIYGIAYRLNGINNQVITDTINFSSANIEKNKIANSLLKIIDILD